MYYLVNCKSISVVTLIHAETLDLGAFNQCKTYIT